MILDHLLRKRLGVAISLLLDGKLARLNLEHVANRDLVHELLCGRGGSAAGVCAKAAAPHIRLAAAMIAKRNEPPQGRSVCCSASTRSRLQWPRGSHAKCSRWPEPMAGSAPLELTVRNSAGRAATFLTCQAPFFNGQKARSGHNRKRCSRLQGFFAPFFNFGTDQQNRTLNNQRNHYPCPKNGTPKWAAAGSSTHGAWP